MIDILQLIPAPTDDRIAWYNEGIVDFTVPACLALVKEGLKKEVVYMEVIDNEVQIVDKDDPNFLGFVNKSDPDSIEAVKKEAAEREKNVKSK